jgi:hypothetical protein
MASYTTKAYPTMALKCIIVTAVESADCNMTATGIATTDMIVAAIASQVTAGAYTELSTVTSITAANVIQWTSSARPASTAQAVMVFYHDASLG